MNSARSLYIDAMRFIAAILVLLFHLLAPPFLDEQVRIPARQAVVIFFVISGFVIAYVTNTKENTWRSYVTSRLSRLYSVVLPAIGLTALLYAIGSSLTSGVYQNYSAPWARILVSLLFLNESWNLTVQALNNGPFWSLCYEFWYYVLFGAAVFVRHPWKIPAIVAAAAIAGPRIVLLFPTWLIGVLTYSICKARRPRASAGARAALVAALGYLAWIALNGTPLEPVSRAFERCLVDGYLTFRDGQYRIFIGGDWRLPDDFFLGLWFALTIYLIPAWNGLTSIPDWLSKTVKFLASFTFSTYLYHAPLLAFFYAISLWSLGKPLAWSWLLLLVLLVIFALGKFTEHARDPYRRLFSRLLSKRSRS